MNNERLIQIEDFLINFRYFHKLMDKRFQYYLCENGLDISEFIYLILLKREEKGLTMVELTNLSKVDKSLTTKVVKKLEEKAYVYRDRSSPSMRNYKICLTRLGLEKSNQIEIMLLKERMTFEENFTEEERDILLQACSCILKKWLENNN